MSIDEEKLTDATGAPAQTGMPVSSVVPPGSGPQEGRREWAAEGLERLGDAFSTAQTGVSNPDIYNKKHHHRTKGLKIFDLFLYPFLTNFGVFFTSVAATYLTSHGDKTGGKVGKFFFKRGEWLSKQMESKLGWTNGTADMAKMVAFSFLDGSMLAPLVKMLEDRREKFAKRIDTLLGTKPADESVYQAEPKQSWWSVLGGRLGTVSIVVPTAVALDKLGLNDKLFTAPGKKLGEAITKRPDVAKRFGSLDIQGLTKITFFEFFYTSVCTAGLYISSRFLAGLKKTKPAIVHNDAVPPVNATPVTASTDAKDKTQEQEESRDGKKFADNVLKKNIAPKDKPASLVQRYEQEAAAAQAGTTIQQ